MISGRLKKTIIVAADSNGCIGKDGCLPWRFSEDLKWFKDNTLHYAVVMGRKTFESIGKPLYGRLNIVLTKSNDSGMLRQHEDKIRIASSLYEAFVIASRNTLTKCFICGGAEIYKMALPEVDEILLTKIPGCYDGDTFFPEWPITEHGWVANEMKKESGVLEFWSYIKRY
jgi:dihydrofolate reductase